MNNSSRDTTHAWDIYAEQLFHHGHGLPLWLPDPDPTASEVHIGDVGWMNKGSFLQLFNAMKDEDAQPLRYGVPDEYTSFDPPVVSGPRERILQPFLYSRNVHEVDVTGGASASAAVPIPVASGGVGFRFKCSADAGAFLNFSPKAYSTDIESKQHIKNYMLANFAHWVNLADKLGLGLRDEDLFFVSGTAKTSQWAVAAFQGRCKTKEGMVTADFSSAGSLYLSVRISDQSLPQPYYGTGPRSRPRSSTSSSVAPTSRSVDDAETVEPFDQCIFIHYYKMKGRWGLLRMKAAAGPHELPSPGPDEAGPSLVAAEEGYGLDEEGSLRPKHFDPVCS